jgi:3-phosphoshikimate 1-carboxyvinyltransferase
MKIINKKAWSNTAIIELPSSKSLSNRALVVQALCAQPFDILNLSNADDTINLHQALNSKLMIRNVGDAGTALRFCTALFSVLNPESVYILTGSPRLRQRPIAPLVEALQQIGANIKYADKVGFAPLEITSTTITTHEIHVDASMSSQFISALCLIAPTLQNGLNIIPKGQIISEPYITMTLQLMKHFGIAYTQNETIQISPQRYSPKNYTVEADWSAASFFYAALLLQENGQIQINGLQQNSLQGDSQITTLLLPFGITTTFHKTGVLINKSTPNITTDYKLDMSNYPDMAIPLIVACAIKFPFVTFTGLSTLLVKESNRIEALQTELIKFGLQLTYQVDVLSFTGTLQPIQTAIVIDTYNDHRIAMAMSLMAFAGYDLAINHHEVVDKSFPDYWNQLAKIF